MTRRATRSDCRIRTSRAPRLGLRAAGRPSRRRSRSPAARSGGRSPRPARRTDRARRSTCATAARRFGGLDVMRAVAHVDGEIARAVAGLRRRRPGRDRRAPDRARRHAEQVAPRRQRDARRLDGGGARGRGRARRAAVANTSAATTRRCMPMPEIQIFGGGAHAGRRVDVQDFMVDLPGGAQLRRGARDGRPRSIAPPAS